jgi:hypothetical protein
MASLTNRAGQKQLPPWLLILLPLIAYGASYLYLAYYHHRWLLHPTVIHEGGRYSLLETMFYASHFLDSVYFTLLCLVLYSYGGREKMTPNNTQPEVNSTRDA